MTTLRRRLRQDSGSVSLEAIAGVSILIVLIGVVIGLARYSASAGAVSQAASEAAREASINRNGGNAQSRAEATARRVLNNQGVECANLRVDVDTSGFSRAVGNRARVLVDVTCRVPYRDLSAVGILPGSSTITKTGESAIDRYRDRT